MLRSNLDWQSRVPKYVKLAEHLRSQVKSGELRPGDRLPTVSELSKQHQISCSTVEKVHALLENDGLIVREQGRGVFVAVPKIRPRSTTRTIGFIGEAFSEIFNSLYWGELLRGLQEGAAREKIQLLMVNDAGDPNILRDVDGILLTVNEETIGHLLDMIPADMPRVTIFTPIDHTSSVLYDNYQGTQDAVAHLISLGHERIATIINPAVNTFLQHRMQGYRDAMRAAGLEPLEKKLQLSAVGGESKRQYHNRGYRSVQEWLKQDWESDRCTAILAQNDLVALGAIEALREGGIRVPEDVSIVGFDGVDAYDGSATDLTTVEVPLKKVGTTAVEVLLRRIKDRYEETPYEIETAVFPVKLKIGLTTGPVNGK